MKEITNLFAVSVETIVVDFGEESSCSTVVNRVEKLGLELAILGTTIHHKFIFCVCYKFFFQTNSGNALQYGTQNTE